MYYKFSQEDFDESGADAIISNLPDNIADLIEKQVSKYKKSLVRSLVDCKSPIEMILALQLNAIESKCYECGDVCVDNQSKYTFNGKKYVADFSISASDLNYCNFHDFIIECDGHDFHDATKEQAQKDRARDRAFIENGYTVIRFTGSEIYYGNCADEIARIINSHFKPFNK